MGATDVAVIGGGLSGLVAAARAADAGAKVTLLERAGVLGGRATSQVEHGSTLNQGPHALYVGGAAARTLRELGVSWTGAAPNSPYFFAESEGALHAMPTSTFGLLKTNLLGFADKLLLARALSGMSDDHALDDVPASVWISRLLSGRARNFLSALVRVSTYAADLEQLSAGAAMRQLRLASKKGVIYVDGGWQHLVHELATRTRERGVTIVLGGAARRVSHEAGHWKVETEGAEPLFAHAVVLAVAPRVAHALVPGSDDLLRAANECVPIHAACLDVTLSKLPNPRHHFTLGLDSADYLSLHSAFARIGDPGAAVFHVARYLRGEEGRGDDAARVRGELEALLDRAQPGWQEHVSYTRFLPRMVVSNALPLAKSWGRRAAALVADTPGIFCAGDWVGDSGMLADAAAASANVAGVLARGTLSARAVA